jgi:DeoR family transcriptional regulator, aga operon transcriptional repressor
MGTEDAMGLPAEVRQARIAAMVAELGFLRVRELSERFGVSAVTLRSDLDLLERRGSLRRVHGGAMALQGPRVERTFEEAAVDLAVEKAHIGQAAAQLVSSGEAVIVDVGSTTTALAQALLTRTDLADVTVITNSLTIALELEGAAPRIGVILTGGTLRPKQHSLVNPLATTFLNQLSATTVFLGCNGVHPTQGVTNINLPEAEVKREMVAAARRVVVLADSTKLGAVTLATICPIEQVDVVVTDAGADHSVVEELRAHDVDVVIA